MCLLFLYIFLNLVCPNSCGAFIFEQAYGGTNLEKLRMSHFNLDVKLTDELPYVEIWTRTPYSVISGLYPRGYKGCKVTCHRNTVLLILHSEVWTDHVQASADAEEVEDLKKQESLTA